MLAAEAAPYAKVGGLADVTGALPKAIAKLGAKPAIVIPAYRSADLDKLRIKSSAAISGIHNNFVLLYLFSFIKSF